MLPHSSPRATTPQDESSSKERRTPVNPAQGLFGLRVATPPFSLLNLGSSQQGRALREELAPVVREFGPEMRDFGLQVLEAFWRVSHFDCVQPSFVRDSVVVWWKLSRTTRNHDPTLLWCMYHTTDSRSPLVHVATVAHVDTHSILPPPSSPPPNERTTALRAW